MTDQARIAEFLVAQQAVSAADVATARRADPTGGERVCEWLLALGLLSDADLVQTLGDAPAGSDITIAPFVVDRALVARVPRELAVSRGLMPLHESGGELAVAVAHQIEAEAVAELETATGWRVRPVLANGPAVHAVLTQYYGLLDVANSAGQRVGVEAVRLRTLLGQIHRIEALPMLPDLHMRLLDRLKDPEVELPHLTALVEQDPALTANLLRIANSAAYASRERIVDAEQAIVRLGLRQFHHAVLASAVLQELDGAAEQDFTQLFEVCYRRGLLTRIIADVAELVDRDAAFTAGLLAGIGRIVVHVLGGPDARRLLDVDPQGLLVAEQEALLGVSASELGYQLVHHWRLPANLADAIRYHDRLERIAEPSALACAAGLAKVCAALHAPTGSFTAPDQVDVIADLLLRLQLGVAELGTIEVEYRRALETIPEFGSP